MIWLFRQILGYVEFSFERGFREDFINDCFKNGIEIHNIKLNQDGFTAICTVYTYKKLHRLALKNSGRVKVIKRHGIAFIFGKVKRRMGFLIGALLFVFIICFLGAFVWNVEIVGADSISEDTLITYLENNGLKSGVMWSVVDRKSLEWDLMSDFDDIAWAHINKIGTTARIEINETKNPPKSTDENKLKGIKAIRIELTETVQRSQTKITIKNSKNYLTLHFFSLNIPLYIKADSGEIQSDLTKMLTVKETALPIGYTVKTIQSLDGIKYDLTDDELIALANKKLQSTAEKELDGYEIINSNTDYEIDEKHCTIKCAYIVRYEEN